MVCECPPLRLPFGFTSSSISSQLRSCESSAASDLREESAGRGKRRREVRSVRRDCASMTVVARAAERVPGEAETSDSSDEMVWYA